MEMLDIDLVKTKIHISNKIYRKWCVNTKESNIKWWKLILLYVKYIKIICINILIEKDKLKIIAKN